MLQNVKGCSGHYLSLLDGGTKATPPLHNSYLWDWFHVNLGDSAVYTPPFLLLHIKWMNYQGQGKWQLMKPWTQDGSARHTLAIRMPFTHWWRVLISSQHKYLIYWDFFWIWGCCQEMYFRTNIFNIIMIACSGTTFKCSNSWQKEGMPHNYSLMLYTLELKYIIKHLQNQSSNFFYIKGICTPMDFRGCLKAF